MCYTDTVVFLFSHLDVKEPAPISHACLNHPFLGCDESVEGLVAKWALGPALEVAGAAATEAEVRAFAVSLLANLSRDAKVCNKLHLHKLRVDYRHSAFARYTTRRLAEARDRASRPKRTWEDRYGDWLLESFQASKVEGEASEPAE